MTQAPSSIAFAETSTEQPGPQAVEDAPGILLMFPKKPMPSPGSASQYPQKPGMSKIPRRRIGPKVAVMSPEARQALEDCNRNMIEEFIAAGKVQKCPVRWASGAVPTSALGGAES